MESGQDDDDLVPGIGCFADKPGIVSGLPGLDMPNNEATPIPWTVPSRIFQQTQNRVTGPIKRLDGPKRQLTFEPFAVPLEFRHRWRLFFAGCWPGHDASQRCWPRSVVERCMPARMALRA